MEYQGPMIIVEESLHLKVNQCNLEHYLLEQKVIDFRGVIPVKHELPLHDSGELLKA